MPEKNKVRNELKGDRHHDDAPKTHKKTTATKSRSSSKKRLDPRYIKIGGLFLILLSLFLLISFVSFILSGSTDQSVIRHLTWDKLMNPGANQVENWMGLLGAWTANFFIFEGFGIASFAFVFVFFLLGVKLLFNESLLHLGKAMGNALFFLVFISVLTAFISHFASDQPQVLGGVFGYQCNLWLNGNIGWAGSAALLLFAGLGWLIYVFNLELNLNLFRKNPFITEDYQNPELVGLPDQDEDFMPSKADLNTKRNNRNDEDLIVHNLDDDEVTIVPALKTGSVHKFDHKSDDPETLKRDSAHLVPFTAVRKGEITVDKEDHKPEPKMPALTVERTISETDKVSADLVRQFGVFDPTLELSGYRPPGLDLLEDYGNPKIQVSAAELEANKEKIVKTLGHYDIGIDKIKATIGPTVTLYEIVPKAGVRISKIKNLEDDIALNLAALGIRIIAPIPGKGTIGIEVPNQQPELVSMRSVIASEKYQRNEMELPIALGKTISNEVFVADLAKMPHLLMAGATGQGKSVGINALLVSLLYKKHPSQLKFVMVDPKKVELTLFRKIERHFLAKLPGEEEAIITDTKKVINTLNSLCIEMDNRYTLLKDAGVRNLKEYNQKFVNRKLNPEQGHHYLPFIVLIIDEFADLMMTAGKEVETPIARLAQLARAIGIHLVIATQRPSVNIITGTIKANFPARIAFRVTAKVDSRTILDASGADQLIGRGDMLLSTGSELIRLQCAFVDTPEVERITEFIGLQKGYPTAMELPEYEGAEEGSSKEFNKEDKDPLFEEAARLIVMHQQGSTSLIQRKMKLGYNRAGRIMDELEASGIVGPFEGSKAREVLYPDEHSLERFLENLNKD